MTYFRYDLNIQVEDFDREDFNQYDYVSPSQYSHNRIMKDQDDWYSILDEE